LSVPVKASANKLSPESQKFFGSFFQKRTTCLSLAFEWNVAHWLNLRIAAKSLSLIVEARLEAGFW
jgi:hypothetical protein